MQEFHRKYYHPSNARIWFYGDDDPNERLRILSGNLYAKNIDTCDAFVFLFDLLLHWPLLKSFMSTSDIRLISGLAVPWV